MNIHGLKNTHEQRYGMITSLSIHSIIFMLFFALSLVKSSNDVKTYYIQFTQMGEQTVQADQTDREINRPRTVEPERKVVKEETPVVNETQIREHETVIRNDGAESPDAVKVASAPEPARQPQALQRQASENVVRNITPGPPSRSSGGVIETEFGSSGAPTFLKRHMPVYPAMARKLGKEGKVVLRLFINEKGRLLNVEVIEPARYGFTESAVEAVKMSTFSAAHEKGISIASKALLTIRFVLEKV